MIRGFLLLIVIILQTLIGYGQTTKRTEQNALLIYSFAKHVNWSVFVEQDAIIIGVSGDEKVYQRLKDSYYNRNIGERKVKVKRVSGIDAADCQILYLAELKSQESKAIIEYVRHLQVLIVSKNTVNHPDVDISIVPNKFQQGNYSIKINSQKIRLKGLKISTDLLNLARETTWVKPSFFVYSNPLEYFSNPETFTL